MPLCPPEAGPMLFSSPALLKIEKRLHAPSQVLREVESRATVSVPTLVVPVPE